MLLLAALASAADPETPVAASTWKPLRLALDCQTQVRVEACTYVRGSLDAMTVIAVVPLSEAQAVLRLNATSEANIDFIHMRVVNDLNAGVEGAPESFEQDGEVDHRLAVDAQRALLDPVLARALAPYLSLAVPGSVTVSLKAPAGVAQKVKTTPWGFSVWMGGYGDWSQDYRSLSLWTGASVYRKTNSNAQELWVNYDRSIELQPSLVVGEEEVALSSDSSQVAGGATASWNLNKHWSVGLNAGGGHDDPEGQYLATARLRAGVEYNHFPSDDPRGNALAVAWLLGGQADWYNQTNTLGQDSASFPTQLLLASGTVRVDKVSFSADLSLKTQLYPFFERYVLGASVDTDITLGDHVALSLWVNATQQAIPGPAEIDASSYEAVTRASYAQPLEVQGNVRLKFYWDNTNSARNNRFDTVSEVDVTGGL